MMKYFISYSHTVGFGWVEIDLKEEIKTAKDIEKIQSVIEQTQNVKKAIILNYQRMEGNEDAEI